MPYRGIDPGSRVEAGELFAFEPLPAEDAVGVVLETAQIFLEVALEVLLRETVALFQLDVVETYVALK